MTDHCILKYLTNNYGFICIKITDTYLNSLINSSAENRVYNWDILPIADTIYEDCYKIDWNVYLCQYYTWLQSEHNLTLHTFADVDNTIYHFIEEEITEFGYLPKRSCSSVIDEYIKRNS